MKGGENIGSVQTEAHEEKQAEKFARLDGHPDWRTYRPAHRNSASDYRKDNRLSTAGARGESPSHPHHTTNEPICQAMKNAVLFLGIFFVCIGIAKLLFWFMNHRKD